MRYALVTGGCGQIGSWFVEKLVERGYRVVVLDPRPPYPEWADLIAGDEVIYRHGTSADVRQIFALAEEYFFDYIYDFGALLGSEELTSRLDSALMMNTIGARNVFELAKMQGSAVYHINIEFAGYGFTDGYSVTKEMALRTAIEYAKKYGVYIVSSYVHHVFCYDSETEIMTDRGWKKVTELDGTEKVLQLNPDTWVAEFVEPIDYIKYWYEGYLYVNDHGKYGKFVAVVPHHKMFVDKNWDGRFELIDIEDARYYHSVTSSFLWRGNDVEYIDVYGVKVKTVDFWDGLSLKEVCTREREGRRGKMSVNGGL